MVDKSWGAAPSVRLPVTTNIGPEDRAAARAKARDERQREKAEAMTQRREARVLGRDADMAAMEQARIDRRDREIRSASGDPHAAAAKRHRSSGRKDVVREQRDTRAYTTVVDVERIRELAKRGASISGLAGAFGISEAEVKDVLAGTPADPA